eukprot:583679-Rhodomonas_salina.1
MTPATRQTGTPGTAGIGNMHRPEAAANPSVSVCGCASTCLEGQCGMLPSCRCVACGVHWQGDRVGDSECGRFGASA